MDIKLEEWIDKNIESARENWLEEKKSSANLLDNLRAENSIDQMMWDVLAYYLKEGLRTREELTKEIEIYNDEIKPKLWDKDLNKLFKLLLTARRLPSVILKEFGYRDLVLTESDPEVKELMEISLRHNKLPSVILGWKDFYKKFAKVKDEKPRNIILYYLKDWLSPRSVNDEYEDYLDISSYEYKNENLKNFLLSLIDERKVEPLVVASFFGIFKDWTEFEDDEDGHNEKKEYIISLFNTRWL